jgi:beta-glucosidase
MKRTLFVLAVIIGISFSCNTDKNPNYLKTNLSIEKRVDDLVSRMTLEEKVSQLLFEAPAIDTLGIAAYNWWNECLHGVARAGRATVFPQAIGLAATWDKDLMYEMADVVSTEARAKYNDFQSKGKRGIYQGLTFWSPNINIFRDPRWGRGMETYGEDPYLSGEMGTQFITGLQGNDPDYLKVIATAKHYAVHSGPEPLRHEFDAVISERDFRDTYLAAFKKTIQEGHAYSVMCAYNAYMGSPCCGSVPLQEEILRGELGFEGYIVSDCEAIRDFYNGHGVVKTPEEASAMAVLSGTDLNCGSTYHNLLEAVKKGHIAETDIDVSVKRLMTARMKLGMFDPEEDVPWSDLSTELIACQKHSRVALEMARKSMVLLKNDGTLPLSPDLEKIAVIGPNAQDVEVMYGNYNGTAVDPVTPLDGIKDKFENSRVRYALGCAHAEGLPFFETIPKEVLFTTSALEENGLKAEYYNGKDFQGEAIVSRIDKAVDFYWWDTTPYEELEDDNFCVKWAGYFVPEKSGTYAIGCEAKYFMLTIDDEQLMWHSNIHHPNKKSQNIELKKGQAYKIELKSWDDQGDALCRLIWAPPANKNLAKEAIEIAEWSDHVLMFMGLSPRLEGEEMNVEVDGFNGGDRTKLHLPKIQHELIKKIAAVGKPITLVLLNGSAVSVQWEKQNIPAILEAWYPGEAAGEAIADILIGDYNPAGRLPVTFYNSVDDLPPFENYDMAERTYRYYTGDVLYPFGHGLSYSTFEYISLQLDQTEIDAGASVTVSVEVSNTSEINGEEVVQIYIRDVEAEDGRPLLDLRGFERIMIKAGETKTIDIVLDKEDFEYYNVSKGEYTVESGRYEIYAGPSSDRDHLLMTELVVR